MSTRTLGDNIRDARKKAGLTQMELAKATNLSQSYIGDIEKDRYNPSLSVLKAIAVATNTPLDTIISDQKLEWLNKDERKIPKDLNKFLEQTEIVFNGNTYNLTDDERAVIIKSLEFAFDVAKQANKRKKDDPKK